MHFSIDVSTSTTMAVRVWTIYAWLIDLGLYCLLAWAALKSIATLYCRVGAPPDPTSRTTSKSHGKMNGVERSLVVPLFHPDAPAQPAGMPILDVLSRFLDETLNRLAAFSQTLFGMVPMEYILQRLRDISDVQDPLHAHLNRGIAQISALRDHVVARGTVYRSLFPVIFPCSLFGGLVVVVGVSIEFAIPMCLGVLVFAAASGEGESNFIPGRMGAGVFAALFGWAGVP